MVLAPFDDRQQRFDPLPQAIGDEPGLTRVPLPDIATPEGAETSLHSVTALASNDVWAVGDYDWLPTDGQPRQYRSVALHWDGTSWTRVLTPDGRHAVSGVTPDGAGDVWMVQDTPEVAPMFAKKELLHTHLPVQLRLARRRPTPTTDPGCGSAPTSQRRGSPAT
ncbi:hypothetical protein [Actinoallomurus iriomotensis]|uniref:Uncharacterized protein n=1 Tax=Actinoallomurus iriomotensis TaxID=478107 RepID=A0A9W6RQU1_9ACTN|nr:hypothetical protein [Actinoallomurus iriomotensis]GLY80068.1 hypothetical protein Airi01_083350 [Actinoallomurus iriomotensis]